jgi:hypothetical protein
MQQCSSFPSLEGQELTSEIQVTIMDMRAARLTFQRLEA